MDSKPEFRCGDQRCFSGWEVMNLPFNFFEASNEEIMGRQQKEEPLW